MEKADLSARHLPETLIFSGAESLDLPGTLLCYSRDEHNGL